MTAADRLARILDDAHFMFGPHETDDVAWRRAREAYISAATGEPAQPWPATTPPATTDTTTGGNP